jgi:hypothetical protein
VIQTDQRRKKMENNNDLTPEITINDVIYRLEELIESMPALTKLFLVHELNVIISMCRKL